jgi:hypothetical protein
MIDYRDTFGRYSVQTLQLQRELIAGGYLPPLNSQGRPSDDGWLGPVSMAALQRREADLIAMPAPVKPWWESRRGRGAAKLAAGLLVGGLGLVWSGAQQIDAAQAVEIIYDAGPTIDAAFALVRQLVEVIGLLLAALGLRQSAIGAWAAKGPIDATLAARIGDHEIRLGRHAVRERERLRDASRQVHAKSADNNTHWDRDHGPFFDP